MNEKLTKNAQIEENLKRLQDFVKPILDMRKDIEKTVIPLAQASYEAKQKFQKSVEPLIISAMKLQNSYKRLAEIFFPLTCELNDRFFQLPSRTRDAMLLVGKHGWFLDPEMPMSDIWEIEKTYKDGNLERAEEVLVIYFRERVPELQNEIIEKFPLRKKILDSVFNAHLRGEYELSIPVFLAQTDGICKEMVNKYLFIRTKSKKRPEIAEYVDSIGADTIHAALLSPLGQPLPVNATTKERDENFIELNRHQVLHGESLEYGSEVNSLKAISLLNYVTKMLTRLDSHPH